MNLVKGSLILGEGINMQAMMKQIINGVASDPSDYSASNFPGLVV